MQTELFKKFAMTWVNDPEDKEKKKLNEKGGNFNAEEIELIACAFKNQLKEARFGLKNLEILLKKPKFEELKETMEQY